MTKLRAPLTFGLAITRIAGLIGWDGICRLTGRSERTARLWSESDQPGSPTIVQALALDAAYRAAGGEGAPLLESYAAQLEVKVAVQTACRRELAVALGEASREYGEAIEHSISALDPNATEAQLHRALTEAGEAVTATRRVIRCLTSILRFGAGPCEDKPGVTYQ